ncbi:TPA: hypothetical protein DCW38_05205 [candidate division WOR-3 bacterium]|jgi:signal transduction histidine kinase|uniref:histidine kinase n=1 Tax=candidate division WOR-3 bacterium TaxID=2052148 RepID=A0A350HAJ7_UNCW3|nr:hypothetical protein [candidate division WOR-3 bacterium]
MKDSFYIIFAGILFILMFSIFGLILYLNMHSEAKIDNYSKSDLLLNNFVSLTDKALHNLLYFEVHGDTSHKILTEAQLYNLVVKDKADSFILQNYTDILVSDSFIIAKSNDTLHLIPEHCISKNLPFMKSISQTIALYGFNVNHSLPVEVMSGMEKRMPVNSSYGFFETKNYLVNYKSSSSSQRHKFTLVFFRLKSEIFKQINDTTIMFVVLLSLATILIAVFIIFYINAVANIVKLEEVKKKEIELLKLNRMITMERLSESIVHNINNPLTNVKGYLQVLLSKKPELLSDFKLDIVMKNLNFVIDQLKSILVKYRSDNSEEESLFSINNLILSELEFLRQMMTNKGIKYNQDFDETIPEIKGVYNDFKMIFLNIIDNAIDSMTDSPVKQLSVRTQYFNHNIHIQVEDTGCGMSEKTKERIFEMYFTTKSTAPSSKDERPIGTGIGLFSVMKLLQKYNGKIEVTSIINKGSVFTVKIPLN